MNILPPKSLLLIFWKMTKKHLTYPSFSFTPTISCPFRDQSRSFGNHIWPFEDLIGPFGDHSWQIGYKCRPLGNQNRHFANYSGKFGDQSLPFGDPTTTTTTPSLANVHLNIHFSLTRLARKYIYIMFFLFKTGI